jgi:hypothetical protein
MPELFKLEKEEFSKVDNEYQWTYLCLFEFIFKKIVIKRITITDHPWKKKGREWITKELVLNILTKELNGKKRMRFYKKHGNREVFIREYVPYDNRFYHLTFWFENNNSDWLWVRNCYPIS